jgi:acetoin utilization deacetylase AcuC-like enzyme
MKVVFSERFYEVYSSDPASAPGRIEAVVESIESEVSFVEAKPALEEDISAVHTKHHIDQIKRSGIYDIACLAAGGAIQTATIGLQEPAFGLIRPPGHHASSNSAWGFCFFSNIAIALEHLKTKGKINSAYVLDIDLHFGDGTDNILSGKDYVRVHNVSAPHRDHYLDEVREAMKHCDVDLIGISAGFDNHEEDWGGTLKTEDYKTIGEMARQAALRSGGGCFGVLEGGYNHNVLGKNVLALIHGLNGE